MSRVCAVMAATRAAVVRRILTRCEQYDCACRLPEIRLDETCRTYHCRCLNRLEQHLLRWTPRQIIKDLGNAILRFWRT